MAHEFKIDKDLAAFLPSLTPDEEEALKASIEREGITDPLIVWREENILIDGHNRWRLASAKAKAKGHSTVLKSFPNRAAVLEWMWERQKGRRNWTPEQLAYSRAKMYEAVKQALPGRPKNATPHEGAGKNGDNLSPFPGKAAERVAEKSGVTAKTVERDASFAKGVDAVAETSEKAKAAILSGAVDVPKRDLTAIGKLPEREREKAAEKVAAAVEQKLEEKREGKSAKVAVVEPKPTGDPLAIWARFQSLVAAVVKSARLHGVHTTAADFSETIAERAIREAEKAGQAPDLASWSVQAKVAGKVLAGFAAQAKLVAEDPAVQKRQLEAAARAGQNLVERNRSRKLKAKSRR